MYIVSSRGEGSIKVRGGQLDVKRLDRVNDDGLEQWRPVAKAEFPIAAADIASLLSALDVDVPPLGRDDYALDELIDEVVRPSTDLLSVSVRKRRTHYTFGGCMAELTDVRTGAHATRTLAVESEDAERVRAAVVELELGSLPNVSFPRGLEALVGFDSHRYAVIDVGTNSVKLHVAEQRADGEWRTIVDRAEITRLGEGLGETGRLDADCSGADDRGDRRHGGRGVGRTERRRSRSWGRPGCGSLPTALPLSTRCARDAASTSRSSPVRRRRGSRTSLRLPASPSARARWSCSRPVVEARRSPSGGPAVSTSASASTSERRGSPRPSASEAWSTRACSPPPSTRSPPISCGWTAVPTPDELVAIGGAVTNLAAVKHELATYDPEVVQGTVLDVAEIDRQIELYRTSGPEERRRIVGLQPGRAEVILAGACIVRTVLAKLGRDSLTVSDRGLRHGCLIERFGS